MGMRVRERKGCWWVFVNHQNKRKAKKIGLGAEGLKLAHEVFIRAELDRLLDAAVDYSAEASIKPLILAMTGLSRGPPHSLRHTFASMLIDRGETMRYVQDQLGHASIKVTMDIYSHMMPDAQRRGASTLDSEMPVRNPFQGDRLRLVE